MSKVGRRKKQNKVASAARQDVRTAHISSYAGEMMGPRTCKRLGFGLRAAA